MLRTAAVIAAALIVLTTSTVLAARWVGGVFVQSEQILYISLADLQGRSRLYVHDLERNARFSLVDDLLGAAQVDAAWSPDGRRIAYSTFSPDAVLRNIFVLDVLTGENERITTSAGDFNSPAWSPDGRYLAYHGNVGALTNWDIYVYDLQTGTEQPVYTGVGTEGRPTWSPDGRYLVFETNSISVEFYTDIGLLDLQTGEVQPVTHSINPDIVAIWSPVEDKIAFVSLALLTYDLYLVNPDGTGLVRVTEFDYSMFDPAWSPDGRQILFSARRPEDNNYLHIYILDLQDTGEVRRVTSGQEGFVQPHWRPR